MRLQLNLDPNTKKKVFNFFKIALGTMLASAKWQEVKGKPEKINELILKTKTELKERPDNISQLSLDYVFF